MWPGIATTPEIAVNLHIYNFKINFILEKIFVIKENFMNTFCAYHQTNQRKH